MSRIRYSVDPQSSKPLRFDDPEFELALEADHGNADEDKKAGPLALLLGVKRATDFDFTGFIEDGVTLHARHGITGGDEDRLLTNAQMTGDRVNLEIANGRWFTTWVRSVEVGEDTDLSSDDKKAFAGLSHMNRKKREETFGLLPLGVRKAFIARLRAHTDEANQPAMRDPL